MKWKQLLIGFAAGCVVTGISIRMATPRSESVALHTIDVKTVDSDTNLPIPVTGIRYPDHSDFTFLSSQPEKRVIHKVDYGNDSGITRIAWIGGGRPEEYRFVLTSRGYDDVVVPSGFIDTTTGSHAGSQEKPKVLPMNKKQNKAADPAR